MNAREFKAALKKMHKDAKDNLQMMELAASKEDPDYQHSFKCGWQGFLLEDILLKLKYLSE